jgi:HSP20 family protein
MATIRRVDPFSGLLNIQRDLDNFFSDFFDRPKSNFDTLALSSDMPILDVYNEDDKEFVAELHVPGYTPEEVDIRVHDNVLEITGRHEESLEEKDKKRTYYMHQSSANFYRSIALPKDINVDKLEADFEDGVLRIRAPFDEEKSQTKKISVKAHETGRSRETKNAKKIES